MENLTARFATADFVQFFLNSSDSSKYWLWAKLYFFLGLRKDK